MAKQSLLIKKVTSPWPAELHARAVNAAVWLGGPLRMTLAEIIRSGVLEKLESLERVHNGSRPFPTFDGTLKGGRPIRKRDDDKDES